MCFQSMPIALFLSFVFLFPQDSWGGKESTGEGKPPVLKVTAKRDGDTVTISGKVTDENWSTVDVTVYAATPFPFTISLDDASGEFEIKLKVAIDKSEITVVAKDEERLSDSALLDIAP